MEIGQDLPDKMQRKQVLWLRWLLVLAVSYLLYFAGGEEFGITNVLILAYMASNAVLAIMPRILFSRPGVYYALIPMDTVFVGLAIFFSGAATTDFYLAFLLIIVIAAIGRKSSYVLLGAFGIVGFYGWMMWSTNTFFPPLQVPFLLVVAFFIGHLLEQPTVERARLKKLLSDKKELQAIQRRLEESEAKFRRLAETLSAAIFICREERFIYVNPAAEAVTGYRRDELMELSIHDLVSAESRDTLNRVASVEEFSGDDAERYEFEIITKDRQKRWIDISLGVVEFEGEMAWLGAATDITQRKYKEDELQHSALHDNLTGLPNRRPLAEELARLMLLHQKGDAPLFAVLYIDLDRFKLVNDTLGHAVGDQLLAAVATGLGSVLRASDMAARMGGDEFVVLLKGIKATEDAMRVAERIHEELAAPIKVGEQDLFISASIGIALSNEGADSAEALLHNADAAMYRAKSGRKSRRQSSHTATHRKASELLQLESDLRKALERKQFCLHYQPIVNLKNDSLAGFEALLRWNHPEQGWIPPASFIPLAEESGVIIPLGWWVLRQACTQMQQWYQHYPKNGPLFINVNLSPRQFSQPDLVDQVDQILKETNLHASQLNLEFTEDALMESSESNAVKLLLLKAMGVHLVIDDFGTGYTLLSHLHKLPTDILKIDRSFVMNMGPKGENAELVQMIVMIANQMGVDVTAEGIETLDQKQQVKALKCKYGQGFLYSKPLPATEAEKLFQGDSQIILPPQPVRLIESRAS